MLEAADRGSQEPMSECDPPKSEGFRKRSETPLPGDNSYEIADLRVEIGRGRVVRQDRVLPLTKLSFDLLVALIQASPNVLTPDLMMERVWPGVVISPETVTQRVKVLRDALGDSPRNPRYIEGVRGRGYRLLPTPTLLSQPSPTPPTALSSFGPESAMRPAPSIWRRFWPALAIGTIAAACVLVYWLQAVRSDKYVTIERKAVTVSAAPIESIAVLPFENLSTAPNGSIIALGMSEAILHHLGKVHRLTVIARTSSFAFQGVHADSRDIARKLNVHYLLEGSVQTDQLRLRVTAQLVDAATGTDVWSIRLDRNPQDIFAVQDEISQAVARALQSSLRDREPAIASSNGTKQIGAWLAFQQGRALVATRRISDLKSARQHFAEAIHVQHAARKRAREDA
jgi:transcriptional activator of cad operon